MSSRIEKITDKFYRSQDNSGDVYYYFYCPGCKELHPYVVRLDNAKRPGWDFNGNLDTPTFTPSLRMVRKSLKDIKDIPEEMLQYAKPPCHLNITDGKIHYHSDSEHELSGKVVDMVDIPRDFFE